MKYSQEKIQAVVEHLGYAYFTKGDYNLNIVNVRNRSYPDVTNAFDDLITLSYKVNGVWQYKEWAATTDPGKYWIQNPMNQGGTAILAPGQYRGSHIIRKHQGKYPALCQQKKVKVYRDRNKDLVYDYEAPEWGAFGINVHRAGTNSILVDKNSAGCQVFKKSADFDEFMTILRESEKLYGNRFTLTLIEL